MLSLGIMNKKVVSLPQSGGLKLESGAFLDNLHRKIKDIDQLVQFGLLVLLLMVATMIVMVADMFINAYYHNTDSNYVLLEKYNALDSQVKLLSIPKRR